MRRGADPVAPAALVCAVIGAVSAGALSLAVEPATYGVFGALLVLFGAAAVGMRADAATAARGPG